MHAWFDKRKIRPTMQLRRANRQYVAFLHFVCAWLSRGCSGALVQQAYMSIVSSPGQSNLFVNDACLHVGRAPPTIGASTSPVSHWPAMDLSSSLLSVLLSTDPADKLETGVLGWRGSKAHPSQRALSPVRLAGRRALFGWMEGLSCPAARPRGERFPSPPGRAPKNVGEGDSRGWRASRTGHRRRPGRWGGFGETNREMDGRWRRDVVGLLTARWGLCVALSFAIEFLG